MTRKAIFLDKDGTLVLDEPFNTDISKLRFLDGVFEELALLKKKFDLIIVTNQSGIALGKMSEKFFLKSKEYILKELEKNVISITGFY